MVLLLGQTGEMNRGVIEKVRVLGKKIMCKIQAISLSLVEHCLLFLFTGGAITKL